MYFIKACESITHQNSFKKDSIWDELTPIDGSSELTAINYKEYIPPAALRRLSTILRMAICASKEVQANMEVPFDSISVGTGLGCLTDTEKFLNTFLTATGETLSPTAFIQSTHNTIGGQISLALSNKAYNMTHTQNTLSFEVSLIDAFLCIQDGRKSVLVGAADEAIPFLEHLQPELIPTDYPLTSGATFFGLTNEPTQVRFVDCLVDFNCTEHKSLLNELLEKNNVKEGEIDVLFHSGDDLNIATQNVNYLSYSGRHDSAVSFACHMAHDWLVDTKKKYALVLNTQGVNKTGIILLENNEA